MFVRPGTIQFSKLGRYLKSILSLFHQFPSPSLSLPFSSRILVTLLYRSNTPPTNPLLFLFPSSPYLLLRLLLSLCLFLLSTPLSIPLNLPLYPPCPPLPSPLLPCHLPNRSVMHTKKRLCRC